ncbi:hypothetical protein CXB49_00200 [Chromobacterium sp. ATCC 53434]|nr:hypothetical protein CXB49_00200 [Chromobacterium sp. ATCC 53434]
MRVAARHDHIHFVRTRRYPRMFIVRVGRVMYGFCKQAIITSLFMWIPLFLPSNFKNTLDPAGLDAAGKGNFEFTLRFRPPQ